MKNFLKNLLSGFLIKCMKIWHFLRKSSFSHNFWTKWTLKNFDHSIWAFLDPGKLIIALFFKFYYFLRIFWASKSKKLKPHIQKKIKFELSSVYRLKSYEKLIVNPFFMKKCFNCIISSQNIKLHFMRDVTLGGRSSFYNIPSPKNECMVSIN